MRGAFYFLGAPEKQHESPQDCIVRRGNTVSEPAKASLFYGDCYGIMDQEEVLLSRSIAGIKMQLCLRNLSQGDTEMTLNESYRRFGDSIIAVGLRSPWVHIRNLIFVKLLLKSFALLHASAVAKNGKAVLISGPPGAGKSATSFTLALNHGFEYMADDVSIVDHGKTFSNVPYVGLIGLGPYLRKSYRISLRPKDTARLSAYSLICKLAKAFKMDQLLGINPGMFVDMAGILDARGIRICKEAEIAHVCFLEIGDDKVIEINSQHAFDKLIALNRTEFEYHSDKVLLCYSFLNSSFRITDMLMRESKILEAVARKSNAFIVRSSSPAGFARLISELS